MQESERLARDKNASLQLLQKVAQLVVVGWRGLLGLGGECRIPLLLGLPCYHSHFFLILYPFGLAGEGEIDYVGKKIHLTHWGQAFSEDHIHPQRGNTVGSAPASGPRGLLGGSGATWGTFTSMAEVEYGDIFLNWSDMSRNGPEIQNLTCYGYQLLFSYFSGSQEPTDPTILGD